MFPSLSAPIVLLCLSISFGCVASQDKPNIIMILADDQGWGDVGYNPFKYQSPTYQYNWTFNPPRTPNLDAMATSPHSILFHRFYAGSGVCSPTRSAMLTGRTPVRECIDGAEGCGTQPAWSCLDKMPLPPGPFTVGEAAKKAGYATLFIGKWHLGDFFFKGGKRTEFAYNKWPVSNPGMHGFDEWHATEASAPSSTTNCGCDKAWWEASPGCITGGGDWQNKAYTCTNYWFPLDLDANHKPSRPECRNEFNGTNILAHDCVGNLTEKIEGDDSEYLMDLLEDFVTRKLSNESQPFLAFVWLHTNHEPHPSLPNFYHNYTDAFGDPAGDYLGTLTQMDVQIGRLRQMLVDKGIKNNTILWYTADNGPHSQQRDQNKYNGLSATNGLRQCKASLYEGGIRVPGLLEWPSLIQQNSATWHPAYVADYLPTILELLGVPEENPSWIKDGMSLLPLIKSLAANPAANDTSMRPTENPLVFSLGGQMAIIDNNIKIVKNPEVGQCDKEPGFHGDGIFLFDLDIDPTESYDLSKDPKYADIFSNMTARMNAFSQSLTYSRINESKCQAPGPTPGPSPSPSPPAPPHGAAFQLQKGSQCLTLSHANPATPTRQKVVLGSCSDPNSVFENSTSYKILVSSTTKECVKVDLDDYKGMACHSGVPVWTGACQANYNAYSFDAAHGTIRYVQQCLGPMCLLVNSTSAITGSCEVGDAQGFELIPSTIGIN
eukprot:m.13161 g.13161  ORF g.13161 m.13161 type:complete len:719 (+) comp4799_c0_seq2:74-2230(+)